MYMIVKDLSEVNYTVQQVIKRAKEITGINEPIEIVSTDQAIEENLTGIGLGVDGYGIRTLSPKQLVVRGTSLTFLVQAIARCIDPKSYEELVNGKNYFVCDLDMLEDLIDEYRRAEETRIIALDIETSGNVDSEPFATGHILSLAIYDAAEVKAFVIPEELAETGYVVDLLDALDKHKIVCHNGTFDMPYLSKRLGIHAYHQDDTLLMHYVLFNTAQEHGLKPLAQRWLNAPDWDSANKHYLKGGAHFENIPREQLYLYNAYDVLWTYRLYALFADMLDEEPEMRAYYEYRMRVSKVLQDVQMNGVPVDTSVLDELEVSYSARKEKALAVLKEVAGEEFNPASSQQIKRFFAEHGIVKDKFDEDTLKKVRKESPEWEEFINNLLEYRSCSKVLSSYIDKVRAFTGSDGRVHPHYLPHGAKTGRLSAKGPAIQTMGRDSGIKRALVAPEGYKIISCDYSQAELRTVAELSNDENMMSAFQPGAPDFFDNLMTQVYPEEFPTIADYEAFDREHHLEAKNKRALIKSIVYGCVPTSKPILTKRGLLTVDDVVPYVDYAWGINVDTGESGWSLITGINWFKSAPIVHLHTRGFDIDCTSNHKWIIRKRNKDTLSLVETSDIKHDDRLVLTAKPSTESSDDGFTDEEVSLLSWVLSDGYIHRSQNTQRTSQKNDGSRRKIIMQIMQAKPEYVEEIQELMTHFKHSVYTRPGVNYPLSYTWNVNAEIARELWDRSGIGDNRENVVDWVIGLSDKHRQIFVDVFQKAEGHFINNTVVVTQKDTTTAAAYSVASMMLGDFVTRSKYNDHDIHKYRTRKIDGVTAQKLTVEDAGFSDVWCPTTEFGTWTTVDDNGNLIVTGNSNYGRGAKAIAVALEKPVKDAEHVLDMYYSAYPNLKKWQDSVRESVGNDSLSWRTTTPFGMRFKQEVITFKNRNKVGNEALAFVPQSTANDICLHAAIEINKRVGKYGAQLIGLVHDATYVLCPEEHVDKCARMMENEMEGAARLVFHRVPFSAEAEIGNNWEEV